MATKPTHTRSQSRPRPNAQAQAQAQARPQAKRKRRRSVPPLVRLAPGLGVFSLLLVILTFFGAALIHTKLLPTLYLSVILVALLLFSFFLFYLMRDWYRKRKLFWVGLALSVLIGGVLVYGGIALNKVVKSITDLTTPEVEISHMAVFVTTDDPATSLQDITGYTIGMIPDHDGASEKTIEHLNTDLQTTLATKEYQTVTDLLTGLFEQEVGAIVMNTAYISMFAELEGFENAANQIRELTNVEIEIEVAPQPTVSPEDVEPNEDGVFSVYISGIDSRHGLVAKSNSDVNILATINPKTKQVLLVSTPRDFFVPLSISNGIPDKLTHAGIYGVNVSKDTLGLLYGVNIDYYFRVNFSGFSQIIDSLGGVNVYSEYDFSVGSYHYHVGENYLNGDQALTFARERYAFSSGDRQRGRNQMAVIKAVIKKAMSPEILLNYSSLLNSLQGSFDMNIPYEMIAELVRGQLEEGGDWNIVSYSANGTGDKQVPYSMNIPVYVMWPDQATVDTAKSLIQQVKDGQILTQP